jgi:hypothetical protein
VESVGHSEHDLRAMAAQARLIAASLVEQAIRWDFLLIATRLEEEADAQHDATAPDQRKSINNAPAGRGAK